MEHHDHHHEVALTKVNAAFVVGIAVNFLFVIIEAVVGFSIHSASLLSDAGHNLADVGTLLLSLIAFKLLKVKATNRYTYGYRKTSILVALLNSMLLLISVGAIAYEAVLHLINPEPLPGITIAIVAGIGIIINGTSALLFFKDKEKDLNLKSAYLHLMYDALVSLGIVIGGVIIYYTHWFWIDGVLSIGIVLVILSGTWRLLRDSLRLSLDGVPPDIDLDVLKAIALKIQGVEGLHHVHVWALSTTENALTAHLVLSESTGIEQEQKIKQELKHQFEHVNIHHVTLETERENEGCERETC